MDNIKFDDLDDNDNDDIEEYERKLKQFEENNLKMKDENNNSNNQNIIQSNIQKEINEEEKKFLKTEKNEINRKILNFILKDFNMNNKTFNIEVCFENDKYIRETSLNDLKDYLLNIRALKFTFLPPFLRLEQNLFFNINENEMKLKIQNILNYLSCRNDILNCPISKTFFNYEMCGNL